MKYGSTLVLALLILSSTTLFAQGSIEQQSTTKGVSASLNAGYISYTADGIHLETETGPGFGAQIQYGFSHKFAVAVSYQHFSIATQSEENFDTPYNIDSPYPYNEIDIVGKFIFGSTDSKLRPNLSIGFNFTRSKETYYDPLFDFTSLQTYSGYSICGGGGIRYFLNTNMSLDLSVLYHSGTFTTTLYNGQDIDFTHDFLSFKGLLGFAYHF